MEAEQSRVLRESLFLLIEIPPEKKTTAKSESKSKGDANGNDSHLRGSYHSPRDEYFHVV